MTKVLVLGYGEHGKDEFTERFSKATGLKFQSSSYYACRRFVYGWFRLNMSGYYANIDECFNDRRNWRALWHYLIAEFNRENPTRLTREIIRDSDIYVGMRCIKEFTACVKEHIFDHIFWVDASERLNPEDESSNTIHYDPKLMYIIDNNSDLENLQDEIELIIRVLELIR